MDSLNDPSAGGETWEYVLHWDRCTENAFTSLVDSCRLSTRSEEASSPQGCAGRSGRNGKALRSRNRLLVYCGIGAEIAESFASGDENDLCESREVGRSDSVSFILCLATCHLRTKIAARRMVHAEAITTRTMVATIMWDWLGPRFANDCLMCQTKRDGPWSRQQNALTTEAGAISKSLE